MKKIYVLCLYLIVFLTFSSCQKKDLELDVVETACKNFKISNATYVWNAGDDPCNGSSVTGKFTVTFKYDGDKDCIDHLELSPKFYKTDKSLISVKSHTSVLKKNDAKLSITNNTITFTFEFEFFNTADADALNSVYLKFHIENEQGNESNKIGFNLNTKCFTPSDYTVKSTVNVPSSNVSITLYDDAAEDGDIVIVYLNGTRIGTYTLKNAGETIFLTVNPGDNHLVVYAVNEGSTGPNTCAISVNSSSSKISLSPDLLTGQAVNIKL